jgi:hypothetical protein
MGVPLKLARRLGNREILVAFGSLEWSWCHQLDDFERRQLSSEIDIGCSLDGDVPDSALTISLYGYYYQDAAPFGPINCHSHFTHNTFSEFVHLER